MPYSFGSSGGSTVTDPSGKLVMCSTGDGRQAVTTVGGLALCQLCNQNRDYLGLQYTEVNSNTLKATLTTNNQKNLRGT